VLSFHATKAFNTMEGGAVVTDDDELAGKMRLMRNFGFKGYDNVVHPGTNGKMIEVCAAMGLVNLDAFDAVVDANRERHRWYLDAFAGVAGLRVLDYDPREANSHHYAVLEVDEARGVGARDDLIRVLHAENILARKYFWPGCHAMQPYRDLFPHARLLLPRTVATANRVIVLPTGPGLTAECVETVAAACKVAWQGHA
jgi:dTDP-4-amino-4,6-dideoxygalactose transaminase